MSDENLQWQIDRCLNKLKAWRKRHVDSRLIPHTEMFHCLTILNISLEEQNRRRGIVK